MTAYVVTFVVGVLGGFVGGYYVKKQLTAKLIATAQKAVKHL